MDKQITTAEQTVSRAKEELLKEAKRIEEGTLYSSKSHFVAASFWSNFHLVIGVITVMLAAIAGTAFAKSDGNVVGGILSIIIAALTSVMTFLNPNERASNHLSAGNSYDSLLNRVRIFRTIDCWREESDQVLTEKLKYFSEQKEKINQSSPQIPWGAYVVAKRGIEAGEGSYEVDKENMNYKMRNQVPEAGGKMLPTDKPVEGR